MAKTNIYFNDANYSIDESLLASASTDLKSHLSTVMNGTGVVINLGGNSYNIDSTKLSTATNALISHLGTIAGNGLKLTINGVEYSVDSTKLSSTISGLQTAFGNLENSTNGTYVIKSSAEHDYYAGDTGEGDVWQYVSNLAEYLPVSIRVKGTQCTDISYATDGVYNHFDQIDVDESGHLSFWIDADEGYYNPINDPDDNTDTFFEVENDTEVSEAEYKIFNAIFELR